MTWWVSACLLAALALGPLHALAMQAPGDTEPADVTIGLSSGASSLRIPLVLPPGAGGFAPQLALAYSSHRGDGPFGVGWGLEGRSEIAWATRFGVPDYRAYDPGDPAAFHEDLRFALDGQLLLWNALEARYHTFVESFQKITYDGVADGWTVVRPDGTELRYGFDSNARVHLHEDASEPAVRWLLHEMEDTHGNVLRYTYGRFQAGPPASGDRGTAYLVEVAYTFRSDQPVGALRRLTFLYEDRPDPIHSFGGGVERWVTRRAREIRVTVDDPGQGPRVHPRRVLSYDATGYATGRSRLTSTQLFGTDCSLAETDPATGCQGLPAESFDYADASAALGAAGVGSPEGQWSAAGWSLPEIDFVDIEGADLGVRLGDVNGDGLPDLLRAYEAEDGAFTHAVYLSNGSGGWESQPDPGWTAALAAIGYSALTLKITAQSPPSDNYWDCAAANGSHPSQVSFASARVWADELTAGSREFAPPGSWRLVDLNDDGLADLVTGYAVEALITRSCAGDSIPPEYQARAQVGEVWTNDPGAIGWTRDDSRSTSVPPFSALASDTNGGKGVGPEPHHVWLDLRDLAPHFISLDDDGLPDLMVLDAVSEPHWINCCTWTLGYQPGAQAWVASPQGWTEDPDRSPPLPHQYLKRPFVAGTGSISAPIGLLADLNGDGLTDMPTWSTVTQPLSGVFLGTGRGWCWSEDDCPDAARYALTGPLVPVGSAVSLAARDVNGDGWVGLVSSWGTGPAGERQAWLHDPAGDESVWRPDERFDTPLDMAALEEVGGEAVPRDVRVVDLEGSGVPAFVRSIAGDRAVRVAQATIADLLELHDNGRGGAVQLAYDSSLRQREETLDGLAATDAALVAEADGQDRPRATPVVTSIQREDAFAGTIAATAYTYARPRWCPVHRSHLGFRLLRSDAPGGSRVRHYFYQQHGRAGLASRREVYEVEQVGGAEVLDRVAETLHDRQAIDGQLVFGSRAGAAVGRMKSTTSRRIYAGRSGATATTSLVYGDELDPPPSDPGYGFGFVAEVNAATPTGAVTTLRTPASFDPGTDRWILGRVERESHWSDQELSRRELEYHSTGRISREILWSWARGDDFESATPPPEAIMTEWSHDAFGNLVETIDALGRHTHLCYDGDASLGPSDCPSPAGLASHSVVVGVRDPLGGITQLEPDEITGLTRSATRFNGDVERVAFDPFGRATDRYLTPAGGGEIHLSKTRYHDAGQLHLERFEAMSPTDTPGEGASSGVRSAAYLGGLGLPIRSVSEGDPPGTWLGQAIQRDPATRSVRQTYELPCADPHCAALTGAEAPGTLTVVDALGRTLSSNPPDEPGAPDAIAVFRYGETERVLPDVGGPARAFDVVLAKDASGRLTQRVLDGDRIVWVEECQNTALPETADLAGVECVDPEVTYYAYEPTGELSAIYDALLTPQLTPTYDDPRHRLRYHYDTLGRPIQVDDPNAGTSFSVFDALGKVESTTNARGQTTLFVYDPLDRLTFIDRPGAEEDVTLRYDPATRQVDEVETVSYLRQLAYDPLGRIETETLHVSGKTLMLDLERDLLGRPTRIDYPDVDTTVHYEYSGLYLKRLFELDAQGSEHDYVLDTESVRTATQRRDVLHLPPGPLSLDFSAATHRLDRVSLDSPSYDLDLAYGYDAAGSVLSVDDTSSLAAGPGTEDASATYSYDARGRLASRTLQGDTTSYAYDSVADLTRNGPHELVYDEDPSFGPQAVSTALLNAHNPTPGEPDLDDPCPSWSVQDSTDTSGDGIPDECQCADANADGFITSGDALIISQCVADPGCAAGPADPSLWDANADGVVAAVDAFLVVGAIQNGTEWSLRCGRRPEGQPLYEALLYDYDADGNMVRRGDQHLAFDSASRLTCVGTTPGSCDQLTVLYDDAGSRIREVGGGVERIFLGDLYEYEPGTGAARAHIFAGGQRIAYKSMDAATLQPDAPPPPGPTDRRWVVTDPVGGVILAVDADGLRAQRLIYEPFGTLALAAEDAPEVFASHPLQPDTGLYYMQARWYDPTAGRFLSVDPLLPSLAEPQSHNAYGYVRNSPVSRSDPQGLQSTGLAGSCEANPLCDSIQLARTERVYRYRLSPGDELHLPPGSYIAEEASHPGESERLWGEDGPLKCTAACLVQVVFPIGPAFRMLDLGQGGAEAQIPLYAPRLSIFDATLRAKVTGADGVTKVEVFHPEVPNAIGTGSILIGFPKLPPKPGLEATGDVSITQVDLRGNVLSTSKFKLAFKSPFFGRVFRVPDPGFIRSVDVEVKNQGSVSIVVLFAIVEQPPTMAKR